MRELIANEVAAILERRLNHTGGEARPIQPGEAFLSREQRQVVADEIVAATQDLVTRDGHAVRHAADGAKPEVEAHNFMHATGPVPVEVWVWDMQPEALWPGWVRDARPVLEESCERLVFQVGGGDTQIQMLAHRGDKVVRHPDGALVPVAPATFRAHFTRAQEPAEADRA